MSDCTCQTNPSCNCSSGGSSMVLSCSGGSNVGQIANAAAVEIDRRGIARLYCLIGVAAHISGMVDSAHSASTVIAIDGCPVACASKALEHTGIPITRHVILTELGIEKNHTFAWTDSQVETAVQAATVESKQEITA